MGTPMALVVERGTSGDSYLTLQICSHRQLESWADPSTNSAGHCSFWPRVLVSASLGHSPKERYRELEDPRLC